MTSEEWLRAREIFEAALERSPDEREAYVAQICGDNLSLRGKVSELLEGYDHPTGFLERPALDILAADLTQAQKLEVIGSLIGQYLVVRELGRGGMGIVYLAERADGAYRKKVAIKLMQADAGEEATRRFLRERQILADIEHPNIARLIDGGTVGSSPYFVMEYVEGRNLREILDERRILPLDQIVEITTQICSGLSVAHQVGVIHRDIKPENLIVLEVNGRPVIKILDFGIAKSEQLGIDEVKTRPGTIIGSAKYMSPEQAAGETGEKIDGRSDLYSLGAIIYELLTGEPVFKSDSYAGLINQHLNAQPRPPQEVRPDLNLSPLVGKVILKSLAKKREERPQSAQGFAEELERAFHDSSPLEPKPETPSPSGPRLDRRWFKALPVIAAILIVVMIWAVIKLWPKSSAPITPTDSRSGVNDHTTAIQSRVKVLKRRGKSMPRPLLYDDAIQKGDAIYFEIHLPFEAACYLLYQDRDGSLVWANPLATGTPQRGLAEQTLRAPEKGWIKFGDQPRKQQFLAVYVPTQILWSLEDEVRPDSLLVQTRDVYAPYARIQPPTAARLLKYLAGNAELARFTYDRAEGGYLAQFSEEASPHRIVFHYLQLWQVEKR
jgi:serine/threonine protein kinase